MNELAILVASAKTTLLEIAKQAEALGNGLQNAAPGDKTGEPNHSVQYLLGTAETLAGMAQECEHMMLPPFSNEDASYSGE